MEYLECWKHPSAPLEKKWGTTRSREKFFDLSWIRTIVLRIRSPLPYRLNYEAPPGHMVQNHTCWGGSCTVGIPKQNRSYQSTLPAFVLEVPLCFCVTACVILYYVTGACKGLFTVVIRSKFWKCFPASNISVDWSNIVLEIAHLEWISLACSTCLLYFLSGSSTCHRSSEMVWHEALGNPLGQLPVTGAHTFVLR